MTAPVVIFRTTAYTEATVVRGLLESHGIDTYVSSTPQHLGVPFGEVRVAVRSRDVDEARQLIEGARREGERRGEIVPIDQARAALEQRIEHRFRRRELLEQALTHRSRTHEDTSGGSPDNESLEFLGDAILGFVVADLLFREFPELDEGQKSKLKARLVSSETLARVGRGIGLGEHLRLGRGEEKTGGRRKRALIADACEALIAAIYLDGGFETAQRFVVSELTPTLDEIRATLPWGESSGDFKSSLQELLQARGLPLPEYQVVAESGPEHRKEFEVTLTVGGDPVARGVGRSKKEAEQHAAREALEHFSRSR